MHQPGCVYKPVLNSAGVLPTADSVDSPSRSRSNASETSEIES